MPKNILHTATGLVALAAAAVAQTGNQVAIPTHATVYNGFTRGYNFTAAGDFFIQDLELPLDAQQAGDTAGVVAVPASAFYMHPEHGTHLVRFACCKQLDVIDAAVDRLVRAFA